MDKKIKRISDMTKSQQATMYDHLRVQHVHHSSSIEGNTLTLNETRALLDNNATAKGKSIFEHMEVLGLATAYDFVVREVHSKKIIDAEYIKDIHGLLFAKAIAVCEDLVKRPVGAYRTEEVAIAGSDVVLSTPKMIGQNIENLLHRTPAVMQLQEIATFHIDFEKVHPFIDGNGRVGRLLLLHQAIQNDIVPPLIKANDKQSYIDALGDSQSLCLFFMENSTHHLFLHGKQYTPPLPNKAVQNKSKRKIHDEMQNRINDFSK